MTKKTKKKKKRKKEKKKSLHTPKPRVGGILLDYFKLNIVGGTLAEFTPAGKIQRDLGKEFDDFIMLVWDQGPFIATGSHTVSLGSQDSLYRGQIQKLLQCCQKFIPTDSSCYNDSEKKYTLTYLRSSVS